MKNELDLDEVEIVQLTVHYEPLGERPMIGLCAAPFVYPWEFEGNPGFTHYVVERRIEDDPDYGPRIRIATVYRFNAEEQSVADALNYVQSKLCEYQMAWRAVDFE